MVQLFFFGLAIGFIPLLARLVAIGCVGVVFIVGEMIQERRDIAAMEKEFASGRGRDFSREEIDEFQRTRRDG